VRKFAICLTALVLILLPAIGGAQQGAFAQKFYGVWYTYPAGNPVTDPVRHEFRRNKTSGKDEMVLTRNCPGDYKPVTVKAVSPIEISENTVQVTRSASVTQPAQTGSVCEARVDAGIFSYTFSEDGTHVTLTNPGGNPDLLELAREDTLTVSVLPQELYGSWLMPPLNSGNLQVQTRIVFYADADHREKMRQIAVCSKGSDSVVSHVDADITVQKDKIVIADSASHEEPLATMLCKTTIVAGTWHYVLSPGGVEMTVTVAGSKPTKLTRERGPGLNY
jgi:hypothetical protein